MNITPVPDSGRQNVYVAFTFHFAGADEGLTAGWNSVDNGYDCNWCPGRQILGSNWFWYFDSPFGCLMEMVADMDLRDDSWVPKVEMADEAPLQSLVLQFKLKKSSAAEPRKAAKRLRVSELWQWLRGHRSGRRLESLQARCNSRKSR
jgi:hypothetical protein